ncbi:MAG: hypothetical protein KBF37_07855 [Saprospiraceae bacterium]|jgi:hypothetical protein|nr:hypothetical protein [Saprospiraceae bacterium]
MMDGWDSTLEQQQRILRYLKGEMETGENQAMEEEMRTDPALRHEVESYHTLMKGLEQWAEGELRSAVSSVESTLEAEGFFHTRSSLVTGRNSFVKIKPILAWAAALAILVVAAYFLTLPARSGKALYERFYRPDVAAAEGLRDAWRTSALLPGELEQDTLVVALGHYAAGRYSESLQLLGALAPEGERRTAAGYFRALNLLALGRHADAETLFAALCANERSFITASACWYHVLVRLRREGKSEDLRLDVLSMSQDVQSPRRKDASELLLAW